MHTRITLTAEDVSELVQGGEIRLALDQYKLGSVLEIVCAADARSELHAIIDTIKRDAIDDKNFEKYGDDASVAAAMDSEDECVMREIYDDE